MAKFDSQPIVTQFENARLCRGYLAPQKLGVNPPPHIREIYTQNLRMFTSFFSVVQKVYKRAHWTDFYA